MNGAMPKQEPVRHDFSKIRSYMALPNLIDVQRKSYERFLQMRVLPNDREDAGPDSTDGAGADRGTQASGLTVAADPVTGVPDPRTAGTQEDLA